MRSIIQFFIIATISFGFLSCKDAGTKTESKTGAEVSAEGEIITLLNTNEFAQQIEAVGDIQLIDVRTPEEVAEGTIAGAVNFDFRAEGFEKKLEVLDKSNPVYLFCRSGGRSADAALLLKDLGFTEIYDLAGGMIDWKEAGKEVVK
ncbi:MAG: rhodanese-like domain-containing protein [Bacteroidia bacterium]|nr:rhodanese-like domain-containing protein [Bacteroidia bacterium]MBT8274510.1 rhodanese-like domain-containing protein [Bacteroidia bacterium]NNF30229.1 rhodanese-like domain-containing protein [Flavobacteriaceae bacterium]NNK54686.1 rhodanese-like domain-containing protein [Flavobacteriaceae bacterium]NNM10074.1 rhodanese-like domain-containing protein [Flavobacteriaceae bacterium]